jgi:glycosyltransferase involved in cell wall biosynthesis
VRLMHVGWGFRPYRIGGLIAYVEDLAAEQAARGHDVAYFFAGRHLARAERPRLRRWRRGGVQMLELFNCPVVVGAERGTLDPERELSEPATEAAFRAALDSFRPDLVHVQELSGLPSSLLEIPRERGIPVVLSLEDYQLLCPVVKLYDVEDNNCKRLRPGHMCAVCCREAPSDNSHLVRRTLEDLVIPGGDRGLALANNALNAVRHQPVARAALTRLGRRSADAGAPVQDRTASPAAYDRRRDVNVARMSGVDLVLAMSHGVASLCARLGVSEERLRVLHFTLSHLDGLVPSGRLEPGEPPVFAVLNGCSSRAKGVDVIREALGVLDATPGASIRLQVWGYVSPAARAWLAAHPAVQLRGNYANADLPRILEGVDVGIVPSVWEEAYGYTGIEFLAAGVPVIGTRRGGIPDYTRPGETGWLLEGADGAELGRLLTRLATGPDEITAMRASVADRRESLVKSMSTHADELDGIYRELLSAA